MTLEDQIREIISEFIDNKELFTALDINLKVKATHPLTRHRDVRDIVRKLYKSDMQNRGYGRTPIEVVLEDGSKTEALLYHSLADSWSLDTLYDNQRRGTKPAPVVQQLAAVISIKPKAKVATPIVSVAPIATAPAPVAQTPKQLWDNLFTPSRLFPKF